MIAAFLGGALNSLAGGGTLVTFPALLFAGLSPIDANASSVVALFSGTFAGAWAYRRNIIAVAEFSVLSLFALSLVGGLIGALLLLWTPITIFASLVPWLILFATIVFALGNFAPVDATQRVQPGPRSALVALFINAVYGGYFGGGIGFLMLAAFTLFGMRDINVMNGLKMGLVGVMTITAIVTFIVADVVRCDGTGHPEIGFVHRKGHEEIPGHARMGIRSVSPMTPRPTRFRLMGTTPNAGTSAIPRWRQKITFFTAYPKR